MLGNKKGKFLNTEIDDYVVFDLETTGVSSQKDEVIEISAVKVKGGKVVDEYSTLVNPMRPIPFYASKVNGIYDDMVENKPTFKEILPEFAEFVGELPLIGHNINAFDMKFLYRDAEKYFGKTFSNDYVDTLKYAKSVLKGMPNYKLGTLAEHFGISTEGAHRALNDCRMNQQVYEILKSVKAGEKTDINNKPQKQNSAPENIFNDNNYGSFKILNAIGNSKIEKSGNDLSESMGKIQASNSGNQEKSCPQCGSNLIKRNGRFGEFYGCSGFPNCRYTENV